MSTIDDINKEIRQMGYASFIPRTEQPNYYRLDDGTILRLYPVLNNVIPNPIQANALQFNIQNNISTFVPKQLRGTPPGISYNSQQLEENIDVYDLGFRALIEDFNVYEVDSKQVLSIKTTIAQVSRSKLFNNFGEPIYKVATSMIAKAKPKGIT
jgi:hypothetical protein